MSEQNCGLCAHYRFPAISDEMNCIPNWGRCSRNQQDVSLTFWCENFKPSGYAEYAKKSTTETTETLLMSKPEFAEEELRLLLTTARILRAIRREAHDDYAHEDVVALDQALEPWSPFRGVAENLEASQSQEGGSE